MACNCKSNKIIEERVSKQFGTNFKFGDKKSGKGITNRVLYFLFIIIMGVLSFPLLLIFSIVYKIIGKRFVINLKSIIKKENRVIVNE